MSWETRYRTKRGTCFRVSVVRSRPPSLLPHVERLTKGTKSSTHEPSTVYPVVGPDGPNGQTRTLWTGPSVLCCQPLESYESSWCRFNFGCKVQNPDPSPSLRSKKSTRCPLTPSHFSLLQNGVDPSIDRLTPFPTLHHFFGVREPIGQTSPQKEWFYLTCYLPSPNQVPQIWDSQELYKKL